MAATSLLQTKVFDSFISEINALKPGNVSRYADGHGMVYADFYRSAEIVSPILCQSDLSMGARLYQAVEQTMGQVGCNTNLGMLLLFIPIIKCYETSQESTSFYKGLQKRIDAVQEEETAQFFAAISLANPGGLGRVESHDVLEKPEVNLLTAMKAAQHRDWIASQYCNGYQQILNFGLNCFHGYARRWNSVEWATVACYLAYMSTLSDSHIVRKFDSATAEQIRKKAAVVLAELEKYNNPEGAVSLLLEFDMELKTAKINPGTSADLTAATVLLYQLGAEQ